MSEIKNKDEKLVEEMKKSLSDSISILDEISIRIKKRKC